MTKLLVVVGSARKGRVADKVLDYIKQDVAARSDVELTVADLAALNLPFFDNEMIPMQPEYTPNNDAGKQWQSLVAEANRVLLISPEYNHSYAPILKNALDYLAAEWENKPVGIVAYGWSGGSLALEALKPVLTNIKVDARPTVSSLAFMQQLQPTGEAIDQDAVAGQIKATVDELLA